MEAPKIDPHDATPLGRVCQLIQEHELRYRAAAWKWKTSYRFLLVTTALFSAAASVCAGLKHSTWAAILAAAATVNTTLIAALDFEVNWRVNRRSRHEASLIALEAQKSSPNPDELLAQLQNLVKRRTEDLNKQD